MNYITVYQTVGFATSEFCLSEIRGVPLKDGKAKSRGLYLLRSVLSDLCTQYIVSCWLIHLLRSRGGSHRGTGFTLTHTTAGHLTYGQSGLVVKYVKLTLSFEGRILPPTEACGCVESKCMRWIPPLPPQEFVIPWRSCWVSCGVGVEEVWWIKLLSPLTHYTFPLDAAAWWITIGLEEAGGGERGRGRKS